MDLAGWLVQNFSGVFQGVVTTVLGYIAVRILRGIRASTNRTEKHAEETAAKVSALDKVSLTANNRALEEWQQDIALRVEAVAESKSDTLAWRLNIDRRIGALEQFARDLDAYAHGRTEIPTYTTPNLILEGAHDGDL